MQKRTKIHPVELIAAQNEIELKRALEEVAHVLPNGVGCALIPLRTLRCLLGGQNIDEAAGKIIEFIAGLDVAMQRHAIELGQDINRTQPRIQAVADWDVDEAILAPQGHGWFCSIFSQRG